MAIDFFYVRPDESLMFMAVAGTVDADFENDWLVDGRPGRPIKRTGDPSLTITVSPAVSVSLLACCNHNVDAGNTIDVTGDATATITAGTLPKNGIPLNPFTTINAVSVSSLVVAVTGNSVATVIGEFYAGTKRTLPRQLRPGRVYTPGAPYTWEGDFGSQPPYDTGVAQRRLSGELVTDDAGLADIQSWYESTREGTRPTLIVPEHDKNDAWLVVFQFRSRVLWRNGSQTAHVVELEFMELPRSRW